MGFGMKEFEQLSNLISEIAMANNIDLSLSIKKFLKDVRSQYNNKLGFEATINQLNEEKRNIENEIPAYREYIHTKVSAIQNLDYLQDKGVTTIDVIGISLLMKAFLSGNFVLFPANTDANNKPDHRARNYSIQDWQIFIDGLKKLKDLKDEINDKKTELKEIKARIDSKLVEKQQVDSQIRGSPSELDSLTLQGIYIMNTLNQYNVKMYTDMTLDKILPMVFVNIFCVIDSQVSGPIGNDESEEHLEEK